MSKFIIVRGSMGVGKTEYAKWYAKENNYVYLSFDEIFSEHCKGNFNLFLFTGIPLKLQAHNPGHVLCD